MDLQLLGLCRKAGKLNCGFSRVCDAMKNKKAHLIILSTALSDKTKKEITYYAEKYRCPLVVTDTDVQTLSNAVGFRAGVFAVCDAKLADRLRSTIPQQEGEMHQ